VNARNELIFFLNFSFAAEYKDLEARVDALRAAHILVLKFVLPFLTFNPTNLKKKPE